MKLFCIKYIIDNVVYIFFVDGSIFIFRFPIWPYMKLVLCMWLVLPKFNGAAYIYENYVRQYVKNIASYVPSSYPEQQRKALQMISLDARKAVERYIDRYGPEAFERVIRAVRITINYYIIIN